jgi:hypothetical protein
MNKSRIFSRRGVHNLLESLQPRQHTVIRMDPRSRAPFDSSFRGQAHSHGFNTTPAGLCTSATPFYSPSHFTHAGESQVTASTPGVRVVDNALQTVSTVNDPTLSRKKRPSRKHADKHSPGLQIDSTGMSLPSAQEKRDAKVQPSKASGGIPDPTNEYLALSTLTPKPLQEPQHLLVVIDLNGTLLFRPARKQPTKFTERPNTRQFLRYCIETFTVVIWSSAKPENVENMCNAILTPELRKQVVAIWGRDKFGLSRSDYETRVQCYKRLSKLWSDKTVARSHPLWASGGRWNQTNTVLVDDSLEKGRSEPFNLIEIPEFVGDEKEIGEFLPQVHDYLNHLSMHSNVSACLRARPFKAQLAPS